MTDRLEEIRARADAAHTMTVTWTANSAPSYDFSCSAPAGAGCRATCSENVCDAWGPEGCVHGLVDGGRCIVAEWMEARGYADEAVAGESRITVPIDYEWDDGPLWFIPEHARDDIPYLLDRLERAEARAAKWQEVAREAIAWFEEAREYAGTLSEMREYDVVSERFIAILAEQPETEGGEDTPDVFRMMGLPEVEFPTTKDGE